MPLHFNPDMWIDAPPERVFQTFTDLQAAREWMPGLLDMEIVSQGDFGVGTTFRETRRLYGRNATEEFVVTAYDPGKIVELEVDGSRGSTGRGYYRFRYEFVAERGGTKVSLYGEIGGMGRMAEFIGRLFLGAFKKACARDLQAMKLYLEQQRPS